MKEVNNKNQWNLDPNIYGPTASYFDKTTQEQLLHQPNNSSFGSIANRDDIYAEKRYYSDTYYVKRAPLSCILPRLLFMFVLEFSCFFSSVELLNFIGHRFGNYSTHISIIQALLVGSIVSAIYIFVQFLFIQFGGYKVKVKICSPLDERHEELVEEVSSNITKYPKLFRIFPFVLCMMSSWLIGQLAFGYQGFSILNSLYISLNQLTVYFLLLGSLAILSLLTCCFCCCCCNCCGSISDQSFLNVEEKANDLIEHHPRFSHINNDPTLLSQQADKNIISFVTYSFFRQFDPTIHPLHFLNKKNGKFIKNNFIKEKSAKKLEIFKILSENFNANNTENTYEEKISEIISEYAPENIFNDNEPGGHRVG